MPRGYEFEVSQLGKIATWGLYASLVLVLVTERDTWWALACFWISLALAVLAGVQYLFKAVREVKRVKAVVMAGGEGTRLRPLTSNQPKPMVPIVGKPCMEHIVDLLRRHGMDEVVVTLAFMPQAIRTYFGDGESLGVDIDYSVEEQPLGTAGSVRLAHERLDETFLVISGDALCDVDLGSLVDAHRAKGAAVTIGLKSVDNPLEFGIVVTDDDGRVERFLEKPSWGQVFSDTINTGIYVLEPEVLRHVPDDRPYDFSKELFPLLLEMGRPMYGHVLDGYWQDIGNLDQFRQANFDALDSRVQLEVPGLRLRGNVWVSEEVDIDEVEPVEGPAFVGAELPDRRRRLDRAVLGALAGRDRARGRARDPQRDRRRHLPRPQRRRRGRDPRPRLRPPRPRARARGCRDRRPGHDRRRGEHLSRASGSTRSRRSRPAPRSTRTSSGRREPPARRSVATARPGSSTST